MIDSFFAVITTGMMVGGGGYIFVKRGIPALRQSMQQEKIQYEVFVREVEALKKAEDDLSRAYAHQEKAYADLMNKVALWKKTVEEQDAAARDERKQRRDQLIHVYSQRYQRAELYKLERHLLHQAMDDAVSDIKAYYADKNRNEKYLAQVVERVERKGA